MTPIGIIIQILQLLCTVLNMSIFAEVILSFLPNSRETGIYKMISSFNYPILEPIRSVQEKFMGNMMIDFSPLIAILILNFISGVFLR